MSKDKTYGMLIMIAGILLIIFYIFWGPVSLYYDLHPDLWGDDFFTPIYGDPSNADEKGITGMSWEYAVVVPLTLIIVAVGLLAAWIGYSMFTTPPPVPLEELEEELEAEEAASKAEEKKDEKK